MVDIKQNLVSSNKYNTKCPYSMTAEYITIHNTANDASAANEISYMISNNDQVSFHYAVDDKEIIQGILEDRNAWHAGDVGGNGNRKSIGIEICYSKSGGDKFIAAEKNAAEFTAYLLNQRGWGIEKVKTHQDWSGKYCPHRTLDMGWQRFLNMVSDHLDPAENTSAYTMIEGSAQATAAQMQNYIKAINPDIAKSVVDMIPYYLSEGKTEGIRGDIAFAQSCIETGNFKYDGSAVTLSQNNFCGLGVTDNGMTGHSFNTPQLGIRAQIQHLKAYANDKSLANECVDPRFNYITRGSAEYVEWLGVQENPNRLGWASGVGYGSKILVVLKNIMATAGSSSSGSDDKTEMQKELYRVRKSWADAASQKGAFEKLQNAKDCADKNTGYKVYDSNGRLVYEPVIASTTTMYTVKAGDTLSAIAKKYGVTVEAITAANNIKDANKINVGQKLTITTSGTSKFPYMVKVTCETLNVRSGPGTTYKVNQTVKKNEVFTIVSESNGWGELKSGAGWISLAYVIELAK